MVSYRTMEKDDLKMVLEIVTTVSGLVASVAGVLAYLRPPEPGSVLSISRVLKPSLIVVGVSLLLYALLALRHRYVLPFKILGVSVEHTDPKYVYRPKLRIEMRNDTGSCVNVETAGWIEGRKGIPEDRRKPRGTWQIFENNAWQPDVNGLVKAHVQPDQRFRTWIAFEGNPTDDEVERRLRQKLLGTLELIVNKKTVRKRF